MTPYFYIDHPKKISITWVQLLNEINLANTYHSIVYQSEPQSVFKQVLLSLLASEPITILDSDLSKLEIEHLGYVPEDIQKETQINISPIKDTFELIYRVNNVSNEWKINLFTSGTTGMPKKVEHTYASLTRWVKVDEKKKSDIWGFAYNPTHIAGLQVFFQSLLNSNVLVYLFGYSREQIFASIKVNQITNISATPTYFRMLLPADNSFPFVKRITTGGEKYDKQLLTPLSKLFPNAAFRNVYASTEAGSLFAAKDDVFTLKTEMEGLIKVINNELLVNGFLLGKSESLMLSDGWYYTGDIIEIIESSPLKFRIVNRKNEMINVGGYKVNPVEVEVILNSHQAIMSSRVYGKPNSVIGTILCCELVLQKGFSISELDIRNYLSDKLQSFKIPRIFKFSQKIDTTRTGKIKRN